MAETSWYPHILVLRVCWRPVAPLDGWQRLSLDQSRTVRAACEYHVETKLNPSPTRYFEARRWQPRAIKLWWLVNAGSKSFSVFDINPMGPAKAKLDCIYPSYGDFPATLGIPSDGKMACVVNSGASNGSSCYEAEWKDDGWRGKWTHISGWDRSLRMTLTRPPHG